MAANPKVNIKLLFDAKKFNEGIKKAKSSLADFKKVGLGMTAAGVGMAAGIGGIVKVAADFEKSMSRVKALSGATGEEFKLLSKTARDLGKSTVFSASQAAEGMQFLAMAGFEVADQIKAMPGLLDIAASGQIELGRAADITSNILSGFGIEAGKTNKVADILAKTFTSSNTTLEMLGNTMKFVAPVAKGVGASLEEVAAAAGIMGNAGIQGGMAGRQLRMMLLKLADPPKDAADAIKNLGLNIFDSEGKMHSIADIIGQVNVATKGMGDAQRIAAVSALAGTEASAGFLALLAEGKDKIAAYTTELEKSGGTAARIAKEQNENLTGSFKVLKSALEEMAISLGTALIPAIENLIKGVKSVVDWFNNLTDPVKEAIAQIALLSAGFLLVAGPILTIIGFMPAIVSGFAMVAGVVATVTTAIVALNPIILAIIGVGVLLIANWEKIKKTAIAVWEKGIAQSIWNLLKKFPAWISEIRTKAIEIGENLLKGIWEGIKKMASWLKNNLKDWAGGVIGEIKKQFSIKSPSKVMEEIGIQLIKGLWEGIKDSFEWLGKKIKEFGNNVFEKFRNIFGIKSPSIVMEKMGSDLVAGLVLGIEKNAYKVKKPFINIKDSIKDVMKNGESLAPSGTIDSEVKKTHLNIFKNDLKNALKESFKDVFKKDKIISESFKNLTASIETSWFDMFKNINLDFLNEELEKVLVKLENLTKDTPFEKLAKNIKEPMRDALNNILTGNKTIFESFKSLTVTIEKAWFDMIASMIAEYVKITLIKPAFNAGFAMMGLPAFASGGIVPGNFSQPVPIMAHGKEAVLNPSQQSELFKMLNGQGGKKGSEQAPNYVYAPQIQTGASAQEVFDALNRHSSQFFSMVAGGIQTNSNLRNAVRGA